jgi:hypothetical protein
LDPPVGTKNLDPANRQEIIDYISDLNISIHSNHYHFFEIATSLARRIFEKSNSRKAGHTMFETDDRIFRQIMKRSHKKYPKLREYSLYTSAHVISLIRI